MIRRRTPKARKQPSLVQRLRDPAVYAARSAEVRAAAAPYHIRVIAARYQELAA